MKAKKHLGQHFLTNEHYARMIAEDAQVGNPSNILEIGPGQGFLTQFLVDFKGTFKVVELDRDMVAHLKKNFNLGDENIIHEDFLKYNLYTSFEGQEFSLVGNFPYNISTQIVFKVLENRTLVPKLTGMFQKEVAMRIASKHGSKQYGILSVLTQAFFDVKILFHISPGNFNPPPKVDSSVISFTRKEKPLITDDISLFFKVVKSAFGQRRKMLRNSVKAWITEENIERLDRFLTLRPEQMSVEDFIELTIAIRK